MTPTRCYGSARCGTRFHSPWLAPTHSTAIGLTLLLAPPFGVAHVVERSASRPDGWATLPWAWDPLVLACLAASAALYLAGWIRLWRHAGAGRGASVARVTSFWCGWLTLMIALVSPLDPLGNRLFAAHMVQHELLMIVAAPLLVLGRPLGVWVWALPIGWRRAVGTFFHLPAWRTPWLILTGPLAAWVLHAVALWLWHVPTLFEAALADEAVHTLQHTSFLLTALIFWWAALHTPTRRAQGMALLSLFTTMLHMGALGALLTLSSMPWYPTYLQTASAFGFSALEDQQLGGLVMWVPSGLIYIGCMVAIAASWLTAAEPRSTAIPPQLRS